MPNSYYNEFKRMEQLFMATLDNYSELARALGFEGDSFFGDPLVEHDVIVKRAKELIENEKIQS